MIRHWLRSPILHFVLVGAALFGLRGLRTMRGPEQGPVERPPIVISADRIRLMQADFRQRWGAMPTPEQLTALIEQTIEEELLYREARALAFDFEDRSVRRRLLDKMRALGTNPVRSQEETISQARALRLDDDVVIRRLLIEKMRVFLAEDRTAAPPTEKDVQEYIDRHRARFTPPAELTFAHVFLSATARGDHLENDAQALLARLRTHAPDADTVAALSDPFPLGLQMRAYSHDRIVARFGKPFAEQVFGLPLRVWSGPIASPYGLHLVWVEELSPPRVPQLPAVHEQIEQAVLAERAAAQLARGLARLRGLYEIRVDGRDDLSAPRMVSAAG